MPIFQSVEGLLRELGGKSERQLIEFVFKQKETTVDTLVHMAGNDQRLVRSLIAKSVFACSDETVFLDERLRSFIERFLEISEEIQNYEIDERIGAIKRNIRLFMLEDLWTEKERILDKVKQSISGLGRVVKRNVIELTKKVQHDYKTEENLKAKRLKIEEHDEKARKLRLLIVSVEEVLDNKEFLAEANDPMLRKMVVDLRYEYLRDAKTNLRELHQEIVSYLNRFEFLQEYFKKLQLVRRYKKLYELENRTNIEEVFRDNTDMLLEPRLLMPANPSTAYLQTDEGADMIEKVAEKAKHRFRRKLKTSEAIAGHLLDTRPVQEPRLNYRRLKNAFYQSDSDLFTFVLNYSYKQDMSFDEKVSVFCKIALLFEDEMDFTGHVEVYEKTRYAIIFPFRKEKKKAVFRIEATA